MSPGPSVAVVINYAMSGDRWVGLWCAWGHGIAVGIYAFISAFGLLVVFEKSVLVFSIVQLVGVGILLLLGVKLLTSKTPVISADNKVLSQSRWQAARDGFLIAFVNPKALVFFTAVFSQFLYQGMSVIEKFGLVLSVKIHLLPIRIIKIVIQLKGNFGICRPFSPNSDILWLRDAMTLYMSHTVVKHSSMTHI